MDYEKKYKEALEKAKDMLSYKEVRREDMEYLFPELKESEDEKIRKELLAVIDDLILPDEQKERFVAWLEKQGEQKHAWSEEDDAMLDKVIKRLHKYSAEDEEYLDKYYWLIELKHRVQPQSHWKPSDEQMEALEHFIVYHNGSTNYAKDLEELRLQLKKLMEE